MVERRRTEPVDELADVSDHRLYLLGGRDKQLVGALEIRAGEIANSFEGKREPGQCGSETVVQVPTDTSALLLPKLNDALSREPQFLGEPDCVDGGGDLGCEVGDQAVVALPQALA